MVEQEEGLLRKSPRLRIEEVVRQAGRGHRSKRLRLLMLFEPTVCLCQPTSRSHGHAPTYECSQYDLAEPHEPQSQRINPNPLPIPSHPFPSAPIRSHPLPTRSCSVRSRLVISAAEMTDAFGQGLLCGFYWNTKGGRVRLPRQGERSRRTVLVL